MAGCYRKWKEKLHISKDNRAFYFFQVLRTFVLVNISWFFDRGNAVREALYLMKKAVTSMDLSQIWQIQTTAGGGAYTGVILLALAVGCVILFIVSVLKEKGMDVREKISGLPPAVQMVLYLALIFAIPMLGHPPLTSGGFIYANF